MKRSGIGPLVQQRANEPFRLAVRLRGARSCPTVNDPQAATERAEDPRDITRSVVGQDALDDDAARAKPRERAADEGRDGEAALVTQHLGVREPGAIIDADVHELPPGAAGLAVTIAGDPMADLLDAREFLDVGMHELARSRPFVPHRSE